MPVHHIKRQPAASTYVREKGVLLFTVFMTHPVLCSTTMVRLSPLWARPLPGQNVLLLEWSFSISEPPRFARRLENSGLAC